MNERQAILFDAGRLKLAAAARYGIDVLDVDSRRQAYTPVRHAIIREVARAYPELTLSDLGRMFGDRDHTTIGYTLGRYPKDRRRRTSS